MDGGGRLSRSVRPLRPQADLKMAALGAGILLREQLSRLGDTPFELGALDCRLPSQAMVPKSVVNDLRRQVCQGLLHSRASATPWLKSSTAASNRALRPSPLHFVYQEGRRLTLAARVRLAAEA